MKDRKKIQELEKGKIPEGVLKKLSSDETILYHSAKLPNKLAEIRKKQIVGLVVLITYIMTLIATLNWAIKSILLFVLIIIVLFPFCFLGVGYGILQMTKIDKKIEHLILTNKNFYMFTFQYEMQYESIYKLKISSIKGAVFRKRKWDKKGDFGTVEFVYDEEEILIYKLTKFPDISTCQQVVESILNEYGTIQEKSLGEIPLEIEVSHEKLGIISESQIRYLWYIIIFICVVVFIDFLILTRIDLEDFDSDNMAPLIFLLMTPFLLFLIPGAIYSDILKMKRRSSSIDDILILEEEKMTCRRIDDEMSIHFRNTACLDYFKINKPSNTVIKWKENVDGIKFRNKWSNSKNEINFGPIDNFHDVFDQVYLHVLNWKADHGYLLTKEQLIEYKPDMNELTLDLEKKERDAWKKKALLMRTTKMEPLDTSAECFKPFLNYLNPEEKIMLQFKPEISLLRSKIKLYVGLICIIISSLLMVSSIFNYVQGEDFNYLLFFISLIILIIAIFYTITKISGLRKRKRMNLSQYIFTDQKIIAKYGSKFSIVTLSNIKEIESSSRKLKTKHNIIINLKRNLDFHPFLFKHLLFIPSVPNENDLINSITYLKEKLKENEKPLKRYKDKKLTISQKLKDTISNYYNIEVFKEETHSFTPTCIIGIEDIIPKDTFKQIQSDLKPLGFQIKFHSLSREELSNFDIKHYENSTRYLISFESKESGVISIDKKKKHAKIQISLVIITAFMIYLSGLFYVIFIEPYYGFSNMSPVEVYIIIFAFCLGMFSIIVVHEFGHVIFSRHHEIDCSYPYLIPGPPPIGMLGAFVSIRDDPQTRNQKFDVAIGGIILGFIISLVLILIGLQLSVQIDTRYYIQMRAAASGLKLEKEAEFVSGNLNLFNILFLGLRNLFFEASTFGNVYGFNLPNKILILHPLAYAGWIGLYLSAFNLIPISYLDGGHILKALFPGKYTKLIGALIGFLILMTLSFNFYYLGFFALLSGISDLNTEERPKEVPNPSIPITTSRKVLAISLIVLFIILFPLTYTSLLFGFGA